MPFDYIRICARMHSVATRRTPSNNLQEPKKLSLAERLLFVADQRCLCLFASVLPILVVSGLEFPGLCLGLKDRSFPSSINKLENLEHFLTSSDLTEQPTNDSAQLPTRYLSQHRLLASATNLFMNDYYDVGDLLKPLRGLWRASWGLPGGLLGGLLEEG